MDVHEFQKSPNFISHELRYRNEEFNAQSSIYRLNYSSLSFEFADMQRYVSRKSTDIPLKLPSLIMRQKEKVKTLFEKMIK